MGFVLIFRLLCWVLLGKIFDKVLNLREACLQRGIVLWPFYCCTNRQRPLGHEEFIHFATFFHRGQVFNPLGQTTKLHQRLFYTFQIVKAFRHLKKRSAEPNLVHPKSAPNGIGTFQIFYVFRHHYCFQKFCKIRLPQEIYNQQNPICQPKNLHQEVFYTFQIFKIFRHLKKLSVSKPTKCTKWSLDCSNLQSFSPPLLLPKDFSPEATSNRETQFSKAKKLYNMIFHISKCSKVCTSTTISKNFARFFSRRPPQEIFTRRTQFGKSKNCTKWSLHCSNLQSFSPPRLFPKILQDSSPEATSTNFQPTEPNLTNQKIAPKSLSHFSNSQASGS
jgi:hypothetical protein